MDMVRKVFLHGIKQKEALDDNNDLTSTNYQSSTNIGNEIQNFNGKLNENSHESNSRDLNKNFKQKLFVKPINLFDKLFERSFQENLYKKEDKIVRRPSMPFRIGQET